MTLLFIVLFFYHFLTIFPSFILLKYYQSENPGYIYLDLEEDPPGS